MKRLSIKKKFFLFSLGLCLAGISGCGESQVSVTITPRNATIARDSLFQFTVEVANTQDLDVTWSIDHNTNNSLGTIDPDLGVYTPPLVIPTPNTVKIRVTSHADSSAIDTVTVALVSGNTLQFGTNLQVTNYTNPLGTSCSVSCVANTVSSGQHSVKVHNIRHGKYDYTLIYTVWSDNRNGDYDVFFRQITIQALQTNPPPLPTITLSNTIQVNLNKNSSDPANPSLATDHAGNVYIAWHANDGNPSANHDIYVSKGKLSPIRNDIIPDVTFTVPNLFSDSGGSCDKRAPSIAAEGNKVFVAWEDARTTSPSCGDYTIRAAAGSPPTNPDPLSPPTSYPVLSNFYTGPGSQTEPSIGVYQNNLYIAWNGDQPSCNGICFAKGTPPSSSGTSWSTTGPVLVNDNLGLVNHKFPSLVVDDTGGGQNAGNVYVVWQDDRDSVPGSYNIYFAKKEKNETSFDGATDPNNSSIHNIRVNDDTVANGFSDTANHEKPSIVVQHSEPNAKGNTPNKIYVVWDDTRYGSRNIITAKSVDGGNSFRKNSNQANLPIGNGPAYDSSIAVDTFGRAHLIWTDERNGSGTDVFFAIGQ